MTTEKNPYRDYQELRSSARGHLKTLGRQMPQDFEIDHLITNNLGDVDPDVVDLFEMDLFTRSGIRLEEIRPKPSPKKPAGER